MYTGKSSFLRAGASWANYLLWKWAEWLSRSPHIWELLLCYIKLKPPSRFSRSTPIFCIFSLFGEPNSLVTLDHGQLTSLILQAQWNKRFGPGVLRYHWNAHSGGDEHIACFAVCCRLKISAHCGWNQLLVEAQARIHIFQLLKSTCYLQAFHGLQLPKTWFFFLFNSLKKGNILIRIN